jgi:hypothetical protein
MMEPRFLVRRAAAFILDLGLAWLLAMALIWPLLGHRDGIRLNEVGLVQKACQQANQVPQVLHDMVAPKVLNGVVICRSFVWGIDNGLSAQLIYDGKATAGATTARSLIVPVDTAGLPVNPWQPQLALGLGLLVLGSAGFLVLFGSTPGKWLFGLRVVGEGGFWHALARETQRFWPLGLIALLTSGFLLGERAVATALAAGPILPLTALAAGFLLWHYLWPLLRWSGAMPWDLHTRLLLTRR